MAVQAAAALDQGQPAAAGPLGQKREKERRGRPGVGVGRRGREGREAGSSRLAAIISLPSRGHTARVAALVLLTELCRLHDDGRLSVSALMLLLLLLLLSRTGRHGWLTSCARSRCAWSAREEERGDDGQHGGDEAQRPRVAQFDRRVVLVQSVVARYA